MNDQLSNFPYPIPKPQDASPPACRPLTTKLGHYFQLRRSVQSSPPLYCIAELSEERRRDSRSARAGVSFSAPQHKSSRIKALTSNRPRWPFTRSPIINEHAAQVRSWSGCPRLEAGFEGCHGFLHRWKEIDETRFARRPRPHDPVVNRTCSVWVVFMVLPRGLGEVICILHLGVHHRHQYYHNIVRKGAIVIV